MTKEGNDFTYLKEVIAEASASVRAGGHPNVSVLVTSDGQTRFQEDPNSNSYTPGMSAVSESFADGGKVQREGTVLYSYGKPELSPADLLVISKVVYIVDDEEFKGREIPVAELDGSAVEAVQFPMHPAFNALEPLKLWDEIYS